jgi:hypothetical protein
MSIPQAYPQGAPSRMTDADSFLDGAKSTARRELWIIQALA